MGRGYGGQAGMWVFGSLLLVGVLVLIGVLVWAIITWTNRARKARPAETGSAGGADPARIRQIVDERYARGELTTEEYTERLHTLGV